MISFFDHIPLLITADGLKEYMVGSYEEIDAKIEEGTVNRTVASTNMNATSSRAHTIVGITFVQKSKNNAGKEMAKTAVVNLVDLAGRYQIYKYLALIHTVWKFPKSLIFEHCERSELRW